MGVLATRDALARAYDKGLDLVEIAPTGVPPVCKIMDYGKFRFEKVKKEKEVRKRQTIVEIKEITLSPRIDTHDFETKVNHALRFLQEGNKVKVGIRFKGREMAHQHLGLVILQQFEAACAEHGTVDKRPVTEGRFMTMFMSPLKPKESKETKDAKKAEAKEAQTKQAKTEEQA